VVPGLLRHVGEHSPQVGVPLGVPDPSSFTVETQQHLGHRQTQQLTVGQLGPPAATMARFNHLIIDQDIQFSQEGFQFFRHKLSVGALRLLPPQRHASRNHSSRGVPVGSTPGWAGPRPSRAERIEAKVAWFHGDSDEVSGSPRILADLRGDGEVISRKTVAKTMRKLHLVGVCPKRWRTTTLINHADAYPVDAAKRDWDKGELNRVWVGDITYSAQPRVMCSPAGRPSRCMTIARGATAHNHRSCRKARSRSPGLNRVGAGLGSPRCCRTASLAARSASRY
jgi:HTH-like domain